MFVLFGLVAVALAAPAGTLTTRDGKTYSGPLKLRAGEITVGTDGEPRAFPLAAVAVADFKAGPAAAIAAGHGLRGEYFQGRNLSRLMLTRIDPAIDYMWADVPPHPSLAAGNGRAFSVRWTGQLRADRSDTYSVIVNCDDGVRVWVDGRQVVDRWVDQVAGDFAVDVRLEKDRAVDLRVEYFNGAAGAQAQLAWRSSTMPRQVIPTENLLLPRSQPATAVATTQATSVRVSSSDGGPAFERVMTPDRTGLKAEYFADRELEHLNFVRFEADVDAAFNSTNPPDPAMSAEGSVRWTGVVEPRFGEEYRFHADALGRVRVWVDGRLVIDQWQSLNVAGVRDGERVKLAAGRRVPIRVEYASPNGSMKCQLGWSSRSQPPEKIPAEAFALARDETLARAVVALAGPADDTFVAAPASVELVARGVTPNGKIARVLYYNDNAPVAEVDAAPFTYVWKKPPPGVYKLRAKLVDAAGVTALSDVSTLTVTGNGDGSVAAPWGDFFIANNDSRAPGTASQKGDAFTIGRAVGTLVGESEHDAGHFVLRPLVGDGQVVARVTGVSPGHDDNPAGAMAGVTIRENLKNRCKQFSLLYGQPGEEPSATFARRLEHWMSPTTSEKPIRLPAWLKLVRHGRRVYAYTSADGREWELFAAEKFEAGPEAFVGLVAFSRDASKPATATFDHVTVTPGSPPLESGARGFVTRGGTFVAAEVWGIDDNLVRYGRNNASQSIALGEVARILYKPLLLDHAEKLSPGQTGVLMSGGDFLEGDVRGVKEGNVSINSVVFGVRKVPIWDDVTAVILHDVSAEKTPLVVTTTDGCSYRAKAIKPDGQTVVVEDASLGAVAIPVGAVGQIRGQ